MNFKAYFSLVKFSHTIFALPFAIIGFFLGYLDHNMVFEGRTFILMILCMVTARNAAMAFNRYLDRDIDAMNERTRERDIPTGKISEAAALSFVILNVVLFILATYFINNLVFRLSPMAIFVVLIYSQVKRFSFLCHYVLGIGLGLAPIGAYLCVTGSFSVVPLLLSFVVASWVSGFDIIYALNDIGFDKQHGLFSVPQRFGLKKALRISEFTHFVTAMLLIWASYLMLHEYPQIGMLWILGMLSFVGLLIYQHIIVNINDISRINMAFFTLNGIGSIVISVFLLLDLFIF